MAGNSSYLHRTQDEQFLYDTIPALADRLGRSRPDEEAVVVYRSPTVRESITRSELTEQASIFAKGLVRHGVEKKDRVGILVRNSKHWLVYQFGTLLAGAQAVHIYPDREVLRAALGIAGCRTLIVDEGPDNKWWLMLEKLVTVGRGGAVESADYPNLKLVIAVSGTAPVNIPLVTTSDLMREDQDDDVILPVIGPDDVAILFSTSGSTGTSKYIGHTHFSIINNFRSLCREFDFSSQDVYFSDKPFSWMFGYVFPYITFGAKIVTVSTGANVDLMLQIIRAEKCTVVNPVPFLASQMADVHLDSAWMPRSTMIGGQVINKLHVERFLQISRSVGIVYGTTESMTVCSGFTNNPSDFSVGFVGRPVSGCEIKLVNDDSGGESLIPRNTEGNVWVRNPFMCSENPAIGYEISRGWLNTCDVGRISHDGQLILTGRRSDIIVKGMLRVPLPVLQFAIQEFPGMRNAVVVGVPDKLMGQEICACIEPYPDVVVSPDGLRAHLSETLPTLVSKDVSILPKYVLNFESLPKLFTGKLDLKEIKRLAVERLKLQEIP